MITSVSDASPMITSVFDASPIRAGIISLPRCAGIYIKLKLVHSVSVNIFRNGGRNMYIEIPYEVLFFP